MASFRLQPRTHPGHRRTRREFTILVIEDSRSAAAILINMLQQRWGCQVVLATSFKQAQEIIKEKVYEFVLVISDLNLPDAPNGEIIDVLIDARLPVIAITGTFDKNKINTFMDKGCIDYVIKNSMHDYEYVIELVGRLLKNSMIKVLIVDDSESFRQYTANMMQKQLLKVFEANSGEDALRTLKQHPDIKLVIVDYNMGGMNGIRFLSAVRQTMKKNRLCVIGMSSMTDKTLSSQFLKMGANDFISKPFTYEELTCRVSHNLEMIDSIENLRFMAEHDFLTGLFNRRAFFEYSEHIYDKVAKSGGKLISVMMDIDYFKSMNDQYGHEGGDRALIHFADLLLEHFHTDLVARVGGEEFALVLNEESKALERVEHFRMTLENTPIELADKHVKLTVSIGVAHHSPSGLHASLRTADNNLYIAKSKGRNCVVSD